MIASAPHNWIDEAKIVVIGGGVIGCSVAYHCARAGVRDVLLIERNELAAARKLCPWLDATNARCLLLLPEVGYVDGPRLAIAYARAARARSARFWRDSDVRGVILDGSRVIGVHTSRGSVRAEWVVDAAGAWAPALARSIGWYVAAVPTRSHYWIIAPNGTGTPGQPFVILPDYSAYTRPELGGLLIGMQEPVSRTFDPFNLGPDLDGVPLLDDTADLDLLGRQIWPMHEIAPDLGEWQFAHHIAGLSMYTPDGKYLIGGFPELAGFIVASGGSGVGASGGMGRLVTDLILDRPPSVDAELFKPDRFGRVDPAAAEFRAKCAAARAGKSRSHTEVQ